MSTPSGRIRNEIRRILNRELISPSSLRRLGEKLDVLEETVKEETREKDQKKFQKDLQKELEKLREELRKEILIDLLNFPLSEHSRKILREYVEEGKKDFLEELEGFKKIRTEFWKQIRDKLLNQLEGNLNKTKVEVKTKYKKLTKEFEKIIRNRARKDLEEILAAIKVEFERLVSLIRFYERVEPFVFPTDDDKKIHEKYDRLPEKIRNKLPFVIVIPRLPGLSGILSLEETQMRLENLKGTLEMAEEEWEELGGFINLDVLEEKLGDSAEEIDKALYNAGFLRQSQRLPNGQESVAYKLPIDKIRLMKEGKELKEEMKRIKELIKKRKWEERESWK